MGSRARTARDAEPPSARDGEWRRSRAPDPSQPEPGGDGVPVMGMVTGERVLGMVKRFRGVAARQDVAQRFSAASAGLSACSILFIACGLVVEAQPPPVAFRTADACLACHNGLTTPAGEDVSI